MGDERYVEETIMSHARCLPSLHNAKLQVIAEALSGPQWTPNVDNMVMVNKWEPQLHALIRVYGKQLVMGITNDEDNGNDAGDSDSKAAVTTATATNNNDNNGDDDTTSSSSTATAPSIKKQRVNHGCVTTSRVDEQSNSDTTSKRK
jgi:hypothetical protein